MDNETSSEPAQQPGAAEPKKKRNLTVNEKLIALRDQKRSAYAKLVGRVSAAEAAYGELKRQRNVAYEELQRIEAACPGGPSPQPPPQQEAGGPYYEQAANGAAQ